MAGRISQEKVNACVAVKCKQGAGAEGIISRRLYCVRIFSEGVGGKHRKHAHGNSFV